MSDPTYLQPPPDRSVKVAHLVFGLLFLGVAGIWALGESGAISGEWLAVLGPAVLIVAGVIGLVASLASGRNRRRTDRAAYAETYPTTTFSDTLHTDPMHTDPTTRTDLVSPADDEEPTEEIR